MLEPQIFSIITDKLAKIEQEHGVEILFAIESGSRAWGFESTDSDYDVRFIYKHPTNWYFQVLPEKDAIDYPPTKVLDFSGWDIKKTLFLLNKSNPVVFEWLKSPIIYKKDEHFFDLINQIVPQYFSPISAVYHYLHMANKTHRIYLSDDQVKAKKYFYALRPILACLWIEKYHQSPPMLFEEMMTDLIAEGELKNSILSLLDRKKSGTELGLENKIEVINNFIEEKIVYFTQAVKNFNPAIKPDASLLNKTLIEVVS